MEEIRRIMKENKENKMRTLIQVDEFRISTGLSKQTRKNEVSASVCLSAANKAKLDVLIGIAQKVGKLEKF